MPNFGPSELLGLRNTVEPTICSQKHLTVGEGRCGITGFSECIARNQFKFFRCRPKHMSRTGLVSHEQVTSSVDRRTPSISAGQAGLPDSFASFHCQTLDSPWAGVGEINIFTDHHPRADPLWLLASFFQRRLAWVTSPVPPRRKAIAGP